MENIDQYKKLLKLHKVVFWFKTLSEGVIENIQMLRRDLKKPTDEQPDGYAINYELRVCLIGLNKVIKQLKRNKKKH